jgi:hypothetical protein
VQHQGGADLRPEMLRVGGDGAQGLGSDVEQQVVDQRLVVIGDGADRRGQGEHHVVVLDRQQVGLAGLEPAVGSARLTLWAMPIAARVIGDRELLTGAAAQYMSPQRRAAAPFDGRHHLELTQA